MKNNDDSNDAVYVVFLFDRSASMFTLFTLFSLFPILTLLSSFSSSIRSSLCLTVVEKEVHTHRNYSPLFLAQFKNTLKTK